MARPLRIVYEGAVYHVTMRGNDRGIVFTTDTDRERFLFSLAESVQRYEVRLYLFSLMTNHIHMVIETPRGNLSRFMQRLQTAYTVWYNRKHNRSGHLFQGRFGASIVDEDEYILKLSRYVHLNPAFVRAHANKPPPERIEILRSYLWSSYRSYIGLCPRFNYVRYDPVLGMMGRRPKQQVKTYQRFVESGIQDVDAAFIECKTRSRLCIGTEDCQERVEDHYQRLVTAYAESQDISFRRTTRSYGVTEVLDAICGVFEIAPDGLKARQHNSWLRPLASQALSQFSGLTQREIAKILCIGTGAAVSKQLKLLNEELPHNQQLQAWLNEIESRVTQDA